MLSPAHTGAPSLDVLYDLKNDRQELNNLIDRDPDRRRYRAYAARIKGLLVEWLTCVKSPHPETVNARWSFHQIHADAPR